MERSSPWSRCRHADTKPRYSGPQIKRSASVSKKLGGRYTFSKPGTRLIVLLGQLQEDGQGRRSRQKCRRARPRMRTFLRTTPRSRALESAIIGDRQCELPCAAKWESRAGLNFAFLRL